MKRLRFFAIVALLIGLFFVPCYAVGPSATVMLSPLGGDPCQNPSVAKSATNISISSAGSTSLVPVSGTKVIYVCNYTTSMTGSSPTMKFTQGTTGTLGCDTVAVDLSGAMAPTTGAIWSSGYGGTIFSTSAGRALCIVNTAVGSTTSSIQGRITYVQE
jgi:hypothetical protein